MKTRVAILVSVAWTETENDVAIAAYFDLLVRTFNGERVNKAALYREVARRLGHNRNTKSVERKFQNYSFVLQRMGAGYVPGLKPYSNIQQSIVPLIEQFIIDHDPFTRIKYPEAGPAPDEYLDQGWTRIYDTAPPELDAGDGIAVSGRHIGKIDFAARDARNRALGLHGERFVVTLQRRELAARGRPELASKVDHVSERDDGLGYDVASFYADGRPRLIEVKTTPFPQTTPFYLTANELRASQELDGYELHRVYHWGRGLRVFILPPPIEARLHLDPVQYRARF